MLRELIEDFYFRLWNSGDEAIARRILAEDFQFRGSIGSTSVGVEAFLSYVRLIREALSDYECVLEELVVEGDRAFAKLLFRGRHVGRLLGVPPTHRIVAWAGAALFELGSGKLQSAWVLGDVDGLKRQLRGS